LKVNKIIFAFIFLVSLFLIPLVDRTNFVALITLTSLSFLTYFLTLKCNFKLSHLWVLAIVSYSICLFFVPNLSNDVFRFLWDGKLLILGENPYNQTPNQLFTQEAFLKNKYLIDLYSELDPLSRENYSCYPILNQFYFFLSSFSNSIYVNLICLRILIIITALVGFKYLILLLQDHKIQEKKAFLFILNPLVIIETSQNLHFETVMLSFVIIAFYLIKKEKFFWSGFFFSLAIQIKLLPLIILPFLLRWIGWKNSFKVWSISMISTTLISLILINQSNVLNFISSLKLYFKLFEFNSFFLHWYIEYGRWKFGYNRIQTYGPYLSRIATQIIILLAWLGDNFDIKNLFTRLMFAFTVYYLLASTVHPWYLIVPLFFSLFTSFKFMLVWSVLVFISYYSYSEPSNFNLRITQGTEYLIVLLFMLYELFIFIRLKYKNLA
jgi:alpha-1,6-mannosyltransferase